MYSGIAITDKGVAETIYFLNIDGKLSSYRADGTKVKFFGTSPFEYSKKEYERLKYKKRRHERMMTYRRLRLEQEELKKQET